MWLLTYILHVGEQQRVVRKVYLTKKEADDEAATIQPQDSVQVSRIEIAPRENRCVLWYAGMTNYHCQTHSHTTLCELQPPFCQVGIVEGNSMHVVGTWYE